MSTPPPTDIFTIHMHGALKDFFSEIEKISFVGASHDWHLQNDDRPLQNAPRLADLKNLLKKKNPEAAGLIDHCRWGLDHHIATEETPASPDARIDLLPPSSGG